MRSDRDFRLFWLARTTSLTGSAVTLVALPVLIYRMTGSPFLTALTSALEAVPYLLFGLIAGALADRTDRKQVMVSLDVVNAVLLASVPIAHAAGALTTGQVLAVAALAPTVFVFWDSAHFGALPALVGSARLIAANGAIWSVGSVIDIAAPAATGALLAVISPATMLAVDAMSFAVSALLLHAVRGRFSSHRPVRRGLRHDISEGLGYLWRHPVLRTLTTVGALQCVSAGALIGLLVVWADRDLGVHKGDPALGVLFACWSAGGLLGTLALTRLSRHWGVAGVTARGLPAGAVLAVLIGFAPTWPIAAVLLLLWGAAYTLVILNTITFRQQVTPEHLMSRVNTTARMLSFGLGWPVGGLLGGAVAQTAGPATALHVTAAGSVLAAVVLRRADLTSALIRGNGAPGSP